MNATNDNVLDRPALDNPRAVLGGNNPPEPTLEEGLEEGFSPLADRVATLTAVASRLPATILNQDDLGKVADVTKQARALFRDIDSDREAKKKPYLEAGRVVDSFYAVPKETIERLGKSLNSRMDTFNREVAAAERRRLEEEARKAREEEQRRADLAQKAEEQNRHAHAALHDDKADEAAERAGRAEAAAQASSNELTRMRSAQGTVASAGTVWKGEIIDLPNLDLEALRPYLGRDVLQKALDAKVRFDSRGGATTMPEVKGARIYSDLKTRVR